MGHITYSLNQWHRLKGYLEDGRVKLDTNLVENTIRPLKLGTINYMFFGSRRGGELSCLSRTLIENCKPYGLDLG